MKVDELCEEFESRICEGLWAKIKVIPADKSPTGDKQPIGEKNNLSTEEVKKKRTRGYGSKGEWNHSIYMKHMPETYCVDFDTKSVLDNPFYKLLVSLDTFRTTTAKGFHFYVNIKGLNPYSNEVDIANLDHFNDPKDLDLIYDKRNMWEVSSREVGGNTHRLCGLGQYPEIL